MVVKLSALNSQRRQCAFDLPSDIGCELLDNIIDALKMATVEYKNVAEREDNKNYEHPEKAHFQSVRLLHLAIVNCGILKEARGWSLLVYVGLTSPDRLRRKLL